MLLADADGIKIVNVFVTTLQIIMSEPEGTNPYEHPASYRQQSREPYPSFDRLY